MSQVDLSSLRIDDAAAKPRRPLGPRLFAGVIILLLTATVVTFAWPLLRPTRQVPTAAIRALDAATIAASGAATTEAVGWVEPDPFAVTIKPLVTGRIETIDVLEGDDVVAGETVLATLQSAELEAAHERAVAAHAEAMSAHAATTAALDQAKARRGQLAEHRRAMNLAELALAATQTRLATARGTRKRLAAEARAAEAALQAQRELTAAGSGHAVALARAEAEADAASAAVATSNAEIEAIEGEASAAQARLRLEQELLKDPVDLTWAQQLAAAQLDVSAKALQRAQTELQIAEREHGLARQVRSPVSGTVLRLVGHPGATTGPNGEGIVTVYDPQRLQARIDVPLDSVAGVAAGQRVELTSEITGKTVVAGTVHRLQRETDLLKNTLQVIVTLTEPPAIWRPETLCRARFFGSGDATANGSAEQRGPATFAVPTEAVREGRVFVFDPAQRQARAITVTVVGQDGDQSVVRGELSPTQRVILVAVEDGERVEEKS